MTHNSLSISLTSSEKKLFELIPKCDFKSVKSIIQEKGKEININVADYRGVTPMYLAIENDCVDIVRYFLAFSKLELRDSALHAIAHGNVEIATLLLDKLKSIDPKLESVGTDSMDTFTSNKTPMIVAAESGSYEMIDTLRKRGHTIYHPHKRNCLCSDCGISDSTEDELSKTDKRIAIYTALTSPAYILHTTNDPILTCFHLYDELLCWSMIDVDSNERYLTIVDSLNEFLAGLLDETRSTKEVLEILNKRGEQEFGGSDLPRLVHAMRIKEKKFVGHPHVQAVMVSIWFGGYNFWTAYRWYWKLLYLFWRLLLLPLVTVCYLFVPTHKFSTWLMGPHFNRLVDSFVMFVVFLCLIFYQNNQDKKLMNLDFPNTGAEYIIILFTVGHVWKTIRHLISRGFSRMFTTPWLIWDIIMEIFLILTIVFWFLAGFSFNEGKTNMERKLWYYAEPVLIAEACLTWATVFAFARLFSFFQMSSFYGPLLVRLYKMMKACFQYILLFAVILLAFVAGLNRFYEYYRGMGHEDPVSKDEMKQPETFVSFKRTFITLFWALFAMSDKGAGNVIVEPVEGVINYHYITEFAGSLLFAAFEFLMVIVVLNMLIATLSDVYAKVGEHIIQEWSYSKTEIYLDYMSPAYILPVPYNLLVAVVAETVQMSKNLRDPNKKWRCNFWNGCYVEDIARQNEQRYRKLLIRLTQRYYLKKCKAGQCP